MTAREQMQAIASIVRAWADPDAENDTGANIDRIALREIVALTAGCPTCDARQELLRRALANMRAADRLLENDLGGFYISAPETDPIGQARDLLRAATRAQ